MDVSWLKLAEYSRMWTLSKKFEDDEALNIQAESQLFGHGGQVMRKSVFGQPRSKKVQIPPKGILGLDTALDTYQPRRLGEIATL
ncbi:hypothetical protein ABKN59_005171 [Abortiporus biennis]